MVPSVPKAANSAIDLLPITGGYGNVLPSWSSASFRREGLSPPWRTCDPRALMNRSFCSYGKANKATATTVSGAGQLARHTPWLVATMMTEGSRGGG